MYSVAGKVTEIMGTRKRRTRVKMSERQWKSLRIVKTGAVVYTKSRLPERADTLLRRMDGEDNATHVGERWKNVHMVGERERREGEGELEEVQEIDEE